MPKIIYVDFDGTLAHFDEWKGSLHLGEPVEAMVNKVKKWLENGNRVIIFCARLGNSTNFVKEEEKQGVINAIEEWCIKHVGVKLPMTAIKGEFAIGYDDRMVGIIKNTGVSFEEWLLSNIEDLEQMNIRADSLFSYIKNTLKDRIKETL
jgi:hypothetical protein